ncbi:phage tail protein [Domibacillus aminovorans]|uniref:phage tail protein n=1 Tax=Domibacillus aminovorans TaxID=29332 RepID=UPI003D1BB447
MKTYTTVLGDAWDKIALQELGSEYLFPLLLKENQLHRLTVKFSAGVVLNIPDIPDVTVYDTGPDWLTPVEEEVVVDEEIVVLDGVDA